MQRRPGTLRGCASAGEREKSGEKVGRLAGHGLGDRIIGSPNRIVNAAAAGADARGFVSGVVQLERECLFAR